MIGNYFICFSALILISKVCGDVVDDDILQKLFNKIEKMENEMANMENEMVKMEDEMVKKDEIIANMKDEMVSKFATLEDDIEDRVSKLEDLSKTGTLRTCSEYAKFGLGRYFISTYF